ncbi:5-dehydro-2-deoxygluconokinase [Legionella quinlivanii]|uniref:5-dehydro-2-deoxygluconokinase n=1 Tax=Legionella quinlivanii TaxID=45073 RepID=UPI002243A9AA|nr:5-dehydro-2-deoxygluconokinase [Legionella quinlivanii]MCW8450538.1 5-dehydro-2-deoxygluconokinase [Legionella quinlivanii]
MSELNYVKERPIDLICMGRVAVDFYAEDIGLALSEASTFKKYLGGCAGNIAVGAARLGLSCQMFSCVGQDEMGAFLKQTLIKENVNIDLLQESDAHLTGLVLLGINPPHHFPLMFYRNNCADMQLKAEHISIKNLEKAKALLFTGTGLSTEAMLATTLHTLALAKKAGTLIIMDLDYRPVLWNLTTAGDGETRYLPAAEVTSIYQQVLADCSFIIGTEEEVLLAGGADNLPAAIHCIQSLSQAPIVVKRGQLGCQVYLKNASTLESKPFPVEVLNVLGAGDAFMAGLLRGLLREENWETAMEWANASGALLVTRHGCAPAMPYWEEHQYFIREFANNPLVWKSHALNQLHEKKTQVLTPNYPFHDGLHSIVEMENNPFEIQMNFQSLRLRKGETFQFNPLFEFAALLMTGRVDFHFGDKQFRAERCDYFAENPIVLHCSSDSIASVQAHSDCELLIMETENPTPFEPMVFTEGNMLETDHRGQKQLENTAYRIVRTVFDKRNRPESNLVVGEIISFQGRWSSYPSHYHAQPEIYHYRFSEPQGFALAENGGQTLRITHGDTYQIAANKTHAHCTAPGYSLYTLWFIRHLPGEPYEQPTFVDEHDWTRRDCANQRVWQLI